MVNLLILFGVDMDQPAVSLVTHVVAVKVLITTVNHRHTKTRVAGELKLCK